MSNSIYNRATQATRQPGSSFKLFVYLTALEAGYRPDTIVEDAPITINGWSPRNDNGRYVGPVPLRAAFAYSINTVAVRLAQEVGTRTVADMAQRFGITTPGRHQSVDGARHLGRAADRHDPRLCRGRARRHRGDALRHPPGDHRRRHLALPASRTTRPRVLVAPWVAAQMTDLLQGVVATAPAAPPSIGRPTAGKTGTTTSNKDGWFIGFSSGLTTGVWMGRDDNRALARPRRRPRPGPRLPRFHDPRRRQPAGRAVRHRGAAPDWQIEQNEEFWFTPPEDEPLVDADGNPVEPAPPAEDKPADPDAGAPAEEATRPERLDRDWLDRAIDPPPPPRERPPQRREREERKEER